MSDRRYTYRFKTEEEFIKEYGNGWRRIVRYSWVEAMDWAFGRTIENKERNRLEQHGNIVSSYNYDVIDGMFCHNNDRSFHYSNDHVGFTASTDMIIKEQTTPTYERRKFVY